MIREADAAMYEAKEGGRDGYEVYDEVMGRAASRRLSIEGELRLALERDELSLVYQPVVVLPEGEIEGVEALVRWEHPQQGLLLPEEFIPAAEQTGMIVPLGRWVLHEAARQAQAWAQCHPAHRLPVAVNLSARQVNHRSPSRC